MRVAHFTLPLLHTVWCGNQSSVLCFACCCVTLHHLHTSNANATVRLRYSTEMSVRLWSCGWWRSVARPRGLVTTYRPTNMAWDCTVIVALSHCTFSTLLVDLHTLYDQPFGASACLVFIKILHFRGNASTHCVNVLGIIVAFVVGRTVSKENSYDLIVSVSKHVQVAWP